MYKKGRKNDPNNYDMICSMTERCYLSSVQQEYIIFLILILILSNLSKICALRIEEGIEGQLTHPIKTGAGIKDKETP